MRRQPDFSIPAPAPWTWVDTVLVGLATAVCAALFLGLLFVFLLVSPADARWKPEYRNADPGIQAWFKSQHNARGDWCCDQSDGERYDGNYTVNKDGSVTLANGHKIFAYMVLTGPNPTGHAIYWHSGEQDYCFAPGAMG